MSIALLSSPSPVAAKSCTTVLLALCAVAMVMGGCAARKPVVEQAAVSLPPATTPPPQAPVVQAPVVQAPAPVASAPSLPALRSNARTLAEYKKDVARHVYTRYNDRVHSGRLPPNIPAVGVMELTIGAQGQILSQSWRRKPLPEYAAMIEQLVASAAPFPAPINLGKVDVTDVWLWTKENRFQLDSLTEGQN